MNYTVAFDPKAEKEFLRLDKPVQTQVAQKIRDLQNGYFEGDKPLKGKHAGKFHKRAGDWRIVYLKDGSRVLITIIRVAHRKEVY